MWKISKAVFTAMKEGRLKISDNDLSQVKIIHGLNQHVATALLIVLRWLKTQEFRGQLELPLTSIK
jgi:hypothetical protein